MTYRELVEYYKNLLIIQYYGKDKFRDTIDLLISTLIPKNSKTGNLLLYDVVYGFNIDTAEGAQLDILGQYIGLNRFTKTSDFKDGNYFAFTTYFETEIVESKRGFTTYTEYDTSDGEILNYEAIVINTTPLSDADYRFLLKLRIIQNNSNHSHKSIDDSIYSSFGTNLIIDTNYDMKMIYFYSPTILEIVELAVLKDILPRPMGVGYDLIESVDGGLFAFLNYDNLTPDEVQNGFTNYDDFDSQLGETLNYSKIITP